jgi:mannitol/fructose-specific phosphotransferase system IIA component (Ntr-type)
MMESGKISRKAYEQELADRESFFTTGFQNKRSVR